METRPPEMMERIVRRLVPHEAREPVLGDLSETYVSPAQYLLNALRTIPFVIASRIRRTQHPVGVAFLSVLLWFAIFYGNYQETWLVATIPTLAGVIALVLRDVYRKPVAIRARDAAMDVAVFATLVALSQGLVALFAPALLLSKAALFVGFPLACILLFFLRLQSPGGFKIAAKAPRVMSLQELTQEIRGRETLGLRAVRIEIGACFVVMIIFAVMAWFAPTAFQRMGLLLVVAGALFVAGFLIRLVRRGPALPPGLTFPQSVAFYRSMLVRAKGLHRTYFWWYILPLGIGPILLTFAQGMHHPTGGPIAWAPLAFMATFFALLVLLHAAMARGVQKRIDQLDAVQEKP